MSIQNSLARLRMQNNLTQERLAEQLQVSRQAIQKWESGMGTPDLANIIKIAKRFGVTIDTLVLDSDRRICEELRQDAQLQPEYSAMDLWESYASDLLVEYRQCADEGRDMGPYKSLFTAVHQMPTGPLKTRMGDVLFDLTLATPTVPGFGYDEPSDLEGVRALSPVGAGAEKTPVDREALRDRIRGAWLGRICGCLLGKPIEGIRTDELHPLLKQSGNWPMHRYILSSDITPEMIDQFSFRLQNKCYADVIRCAPADDDTNYVVMAQALVETFGRDFTSDDVAKTWIDRQPKSAYCTAERVAFRNFINGFRPPKSAQYQNPYREWIGAQIRGDYFGYINPGNPALAAEMAWRDARISHVKNGIYGEMFVAAMIACAAAESDPAALIRAGLGQIPVSSRLYEAVSGVLDGFLGGVSRQECMARIHRQWDEHDSYDWCHTIPNAMLVSAALLYGGGDFARSICMVVQEGFDTDCNGATVGSILGMRGGAGAIAEEWTKPLSGMLETNVFGVGTVRIDDAVEKTLSHIV